MKATTTAVSLYRPEGEGARKAALRFSTIGLVVLFLLIWLI
jgi:hypothetical protein